VLIGVMIGIFLQPIITQGMTPFGKLFLSANMFLLIATLLMLAAIDWRSI